MFVATSSRFEEFERKLVRLLQAVATKRRVRAISRGPRNLLDADYLILHDGPKSDSTPIGLLSEMGGWSNPSRLLVQIVQVAFMSRVLMGKTNIESISSSVSPDYLEHIIKSYRISDKFLPSVAPPESSIRDIGDRQVGVYLQFLLVGLRFLPLSFIGDVCRVYKIHLTQVSPNSFRKIMCFLILCKALDIALDVDMFHYFYCMTSIEDWVTFSSRQGVVNICIGLSESIKLWKEELFFVDSSAFLFPMYFGKTSRCLAGRHEARGLP
ncbi:unnamed protein product [Lactuca virosa]|uniref:Transposase (putative) gypsy type domain-containing protein n=1 Tax=Lactuca virosa TaxID=75947 RepID=A0AAU9LR58_9ASTR|nr:unnamed protein product [Lactuca virosa]